MSIICSYYTDVAIRQLAGIIGAAYHIELLAQFYRLRRCIITFDFEAGIGCRRRSITDCILQIPDVRSIGSFCTAASYILDHMIAVIQSLRGQGDGLRPCAIRSNSYTGAGNDCGISTGIF